MEFNTDNFEKLKLIYPACETIYQLHFGTYDGFSENLKKARELYKEEFPNSTEEEFSNFLGNANYYHQMITGCHYFAGKTSFWKESFGYKEKKEE